MKRPKSLANPTIGAIYRLAVPPTKVIQNNPQTQTATPSVQMPVMPQAPEEDGSLVPTSVNEVNQKQINNPIGSAADFFNKNIKKFATKYKQILSSPEARKTIDAYHALQSARRASSDIGAAFNPAKQLVNKFDEQDRARWAAGIKPALYRGTYAREYGQNMARPSLSEKAQTSANSFLNFGANLPKDYEFKEDNNLNKQNESNQDNKHHPDVMHGPQRRKPRIRPK